MSKGNELRVALASNDSGARVRSEGRSLRSAVKASAFPAERLAVVASPILASLLLGCATEVGEETTGVTHQNVEEPSSMPLSEKTESGTVVAPQRHWILAGDDTVDESRLPAGVRAQSQEEALDEDLGEIARDAGWTMDEARAYHRSERAVGRAAVEVANKRPDVFVGSVLSEEPTAPAELLVKGRVDAEVLEIVQREDAKIRIVDGQPFSAIELDERVAALNAKLGDLGYEDRAVGADISRRGNLSATVRRSGRTAHLTAQSIRERLPEAVRAAHINIVDQQVVTPTTNLGNAFIVADTPYHPCQSAFGVGQPFMGGWFVNGVLTADHCSGLNLIRVPNTSVYLDFPWREGHTGQYGDVERHEVTDWNNLPGDDFYATDTSVRDVASVEPHNAISVNEYVCIYSRQRSYKDCTSKVRIVKGVVYPNLKMMVMDKDLGIGGDSGGGRFFNYVAYGIHSGSAIFDEVSGDIWSIADWTDDALGTDSHVMY